MDEPTYQLQIANQSRNPWTFCVYLSPPAVNVATPPPLAWLTAKALPTTQVTLQWTTEVGFFWSSSAVADGGQVRVNSQQLWAADLEVSNCVTFTARNGQPTFADQCEGANDGFLYIVQDRHVQANQSMVGMAVAGKASSLVPAQPNVDLVIAPRFEYWLTFGLYEAGQPVDLYEVTQATPIVFPQNCNSLSVCLNSQNLWEPD